MLNRYYGRGTAVG